MPQSSDIDPDTHKPSVALHIGAHKTATTHFQHSLDAYEEALAGRGVHFYGPTKLRQPECSLIDLFGLQLPGAKPKPTRPPAEQRAFMIGHGHRLLLSDENFIGNLQTKAGETRMPIYPDAATRIAALSEAIDLGPMDIFLGIRHPAHYRISTYSQLLMAGDPLPFRTYLEKAPLQAIYWPGLIARIRNAPGVGRIIVWKYEDYTALFDTLVARMTLTDLQVAPIAHIAHRGLSERAVEATMQRAAQEPGRGFGREARQAHPIAEGHPAFMPFSQDELAATTADYDKQQSDIARIKGVEILRP